MNRLKSDKQPPKVKRLLRRKNSGEFFRREGWTENPEEAEIYVDALEAAQTCARHGLNDVELTLRIEARACDIFCTWIC